MEVDSVFGFCNLSVSTRQPTYAKLKKVSFFLYLGKIMKAYRYKPPNNPTSTSIEGGFVGGGESTNIVWRLISMHFIPFPHLLR